MSFRRNVRIVGQMLLLAILARGSSPAMSHEETMVRTAYAKFAYASEQGAVGELAMEANGRPLPKRYTGMTSNQRLADAQVSFTLQDFVVGDVRDILDHRAVDFISPPA